MTQAWNPAQTSASITLSGSNLIATKATSSGTDGTTYGIVSAATIGRYYWEVVVTGGATAGAGIGNTSTDATAGRFLGGFADTIGWFGGGGVFNNNAQAATWATFASGNTLGFALDLVSSFIWGRVGAAGNWNNAAIGSQNPAVGSQVGGFGIPGAVTFAAVVPGANLNATASDVVTGKFASGSWVGTPPAGFSSFDVAAGAGLGRTLLMGVGGSIVRRDFRAIRALLGGREP